jgi:Fur family peroxide stress response transcriptional regulator
MEASCRNHGLSLTHQRRTLLETLIQRTDHPTADQLFEDLKEQIKGLSRTTVYRILETFVQAGIVIKISSQQAKSRFDANIRRHHHICCVQCGEVSDLVVSGFDLPAIPDIHPSGFQIYDYAITFTGLCCRCQNSRSQKTQPPDPTTDINHKQSTSSK